MHELTDQHDVIKVRFDDDEIDGVVLTSAWRNYYDAETVSVALSEVIKQGLPDDVRLGEAQLPHELPTGQMDPATWRAFWDEFNAYNDAVVRLRNRAVAGEIADWNPPTEVSDDRRRVGVEYVGGRFEAIHLEPKWASEAPLQELSDRITDTLRSAPLVTERPTDPDREAMRTHGANFMRYLAGN